MVLLVEWEVGKSLSWGGEVRNRYEFGLYIYIKVFVDFICYLSYHYATLFSNWARTS